MLLAVVSDDTIVSTQLLNGTNVYLVTNFTGPDPNNVGATTYVFCQPGDFVLNGGWSLDGFDTPGQIVTDGSIGPVQNLDSSLSEGAGWFATVEGGTQDVSVWAYCFDNSP